MKPSIAEQLKNVKITSEEYGKLPLREEANFFEPITEKQWDKLNMIRKNLKILERYIKTNKGENLVDWAKSVNEKGLSQIVLSKIGNYNDSTKGITFYCLNLQNFYDNEEEKYDKLEEKETIPDEKVKQNVETFRKERERLRIIRKASRKIKLKDLKKSDKGYILKETEEPKEVKSEIKIDEKQIEEKTKSNIKIWLAGALITIAVVGVAMTLVNKNKQ